MHRDAPLWTVTNQAIQSSQLRGHKRPEAGGEQTRQNGSMLGYSSCLSGTPTFDMLTKELEVGPVETSLAWTYTASRGKATSGIGGLGILNLILGDLQVAWGNRGASINTKYALHLKG